MLSVIWLIGGVPLSEKTLASETTADAEVSALSNAAVKDLLHNPVLYFYKEHLDWLHFIADVPSVESDNRISVWLDNGTLNTLTIIISYQCFISSFS